MDTYKIILTFLTRIFLFSPNKIRQLQQREHNFAMLI